MGRRLLRVAGLACVVAVGVVMAQAPEVVFQSAYNRQFIVRSCSNANPIVVTIQAPAATDPLSYIPLDAGSLVTISGVSGNTNCNVTNNAITVLTATTFSLTGVVGNGVSTTPGIGVTNTISSAATPSIPMNNVGQSGHLISVEFPTAVASVTPIQVRIESADTCPDPPFCATGNWRPISADIVGVGEVGTGTYFQLGSANGVWRAIRVNSILATPTSLPMRVDYTGSPFPFGPIFNNGDFFTILTPFSTGVGQFEFVAGACQDGTAGLAFNGPAPLPEAQCITGTDEVLAVAAFDTTTTECVEDSLLLESIGTPTELEASVLWQAAGTGTMEWALATACVEPGDQLGEIAFSVAETVTGTASSANALVRTTFAPATTGCLAGQYLFFQLCRTGGTGTLAVDALMKSLQLQPSQ